MPTLEPWDAGLTIIGSRKRLSATARSASERNTTNSGVGTPIAAARRLVRSLSIAIAEPVTPLPV